jgi:UDP-N-acetylmuramate: L-alanyl-gamma-D-glutamyl-meso-diaminopimelate ligase
LITLKASDIYNQSLDKQRIIVTGAQSGLVASMIRHVLNFNERKFDYVFDNESPAVSAEAPLIIIQANSQLLDYKHHIAILTNPTSNSQVEELEKLADATPKGGTLLYTELNPIIKKIGSKERTDVQLIAYKVFEHNKKGSDVKLISSTGEQFPVSLITDSQLECASAARELLKKIGISSSQFYKALGTYSPV